MLSRPAVARIGDLPRITPSQAGDPTWTPLRHALGLGAFGVNAWHGDAAGDTVIEPHDEVPAASDPGGHEELYVVLTGRARFVVDGDEVDLGPGAVVAVPPHVHRGATALADGTTVLAVGAPRGEAFAPSDWERRAIEGAGLS